VRALPFAQPQAMPLMRCSLPSEVAINSKSRHAMKKFSDLTEREVLAVAIASEEEDGRIYMSFAENLAERYPQSARIFEQVGIGEICQIGERAIDIRGAGHVGRRTQSVTCPRLASAAGP
jgi:hypothetical protein